MGSATEQKNDENSSCTRKCVGKPPARASTSTVSRAPLSTVEGNTINSVGSSNRRCSAPPQARKIVLLATSLDEENKKLLEEFARNFEIVVTEDAEHIGITHLVIRTSKTGVIKQRTMKYLISLMHGHWIVSPLWMQVSLDRGGIQDELDFEVSYCGKPRFLHIY